VHVCSITFKRHRQRLKGLLAEIGLHNAEAISHNVLLFEQLLRKTTKPQVLCPVRTRFEAVSKGLHLILLPLRTEESHLPASALSVPQARLKTDHSSLLLLRKQQGKQYAIDPLLLYILPVKPLHKL
jgi:hypothetical protein